MPFKSSPHAGSEAVRLKDVAAIFEELVGEALGAVRKGWELEWAIEEVAAEGDDEDAASILRHPVLGADHLVLYAIAASDESAPDDPERPTPVVRLQISHVLEEEDRGH